MKNSWLKKWEIALLLALSITLCTGAWAQRESAELSSSLVRLHVIAASDDKAEQALKLEVRDSVLEYLAPKLEGVTGAEGARAVIEGSLEGIRTAASRAADGREVAVTLGEEMYPTREYDGFRLPAGRYSSLRVTLGEGAGQNWWCVVFPPLCMGAASDFDEAAALSGLSDKDICFITKTDDYVLKFKSLELLAKLGEVFS